MSVKKRKWFPAPEDSDASIVVQGVPEAQQTMSLEKVFWSHFSPNLGLTAWIIGLLLAASGLDFWWGLLAIVAGNVLGAIPVALSGMMGPLTGLTQIENSRFAFGRDGTRVPALLTWSMCVGFNAAGNIPATIALIAMLALAHVAAPFWLALAVLQGCSLLAGAHGHHLVQVLQKYLGYYLLSAFIIIGIIAVTKGDASGAARHAITPVNVALGFALVASNALSWAPYSSDYTRYVPKTTSGAAVFMRSFLGIVVSIVVMEVLGLLTVTRISSTAPTPLIASITALSGGFAPFALLALVLGTLVGNAVNDTTASYSLISAGVRIPRPVSAVLTGTLGYIVAVVGAGQFTALYIQFLLVILYWVAPWAGIALADWYLYRGQRRESAGGWTVGATIFVIVTSLTILLFSSTELYTGPVAKMLGGIDVGYFVGFFAAALLYLGIARDQAEVGHKPDSMRSRSPLRRWL